MGSVWWVALCSLDEEQVKIISFYVRQTLSSYEGVEIYTVDWWLDCFSAIFLVHVDFCHILTSNESSGYGFRIADSHFLLSLIMTMALSGLVFEIWAWDRQTTTDKRLRCLRCPTCWPGHLTNKTIITTDNMTSVRDRSMLFKYDCPSCPPTA